LTDRPERQEFTTAQAAEWLTAHGLRMSRRTVSRRIDEGLLGARRTTGGARRVRLRALEAYLRDHS